MDKRPTIAVDAQTAATVVHRFGTYAAERLAGRMACEEVAAIADLLTELGSKGLAEYWTGVHESECADDCAGPAEPTTEAHEGTVAKVWAHALEDGGTITAFTLDGAPGAFWGGADWLPLLEDAIALGTRVRVTASVPEPQACADPMCGDGCCNDPECTNVPAAERVRPFLVRADAIEWL